MTQPDNDNETDELARRLEREFGPRQPPPGGPPEIQPLRGPPPQGRAARPPQPPASRALLAAIVIIYVVSSALSQSLFQPDLTTLVLLGAKVNDLIRGGEYWRLLTATFLHANLIHIFFNGYALYTLGPESERIYGTRPFLALYVLAGLGGSLASYLMSPAISVGASGSIFGLIGGLGIFYYLNRVVLGDFGRMQVQSMVTIAMINLFIGFSSQGIIDNWGHLGGLAGGVLAGLALAPRLRVDAQLYPPVLVREQPQLAWAGTAALLVAIVAMALLLPPAT